MKTTIKIILTVIVLISFTHAEAQMFIAIHPPHPYYRRIPRPIVHSLPEKIWIEGHWKYNNRLQIFIWIPSHWFYPNRININVRQRNFNE